MAITDLIPPEVKGDDFYNALSIIASLESVKTILEIGSSSGEGSTESLVNAIKGRSDSDSVRLFCMELSRPRFTKLVSNYSDLPFLKAYNLSSVSLKEFPSTEEITYFYNSVKTNLNQYPLEMVLGWVQQDKMYIEDNCFDINGIEIIKTANKINKFDLVLIDGSEFTGERELYSLIGANFIALDDVNTFKCFNCYKILENHPYYQIVERNMILRNGFAIFQKIFRE
jgi:hypothetical protein